MSTQGTADVAAAVALPFTAVIGAGVLAVKGVMWCGEKMRERYEAASRSFEIQAEQEKAELSAQPEDRSYVLSAVIEQFTTSAHLRSFENSASSDSASAALEEATIAKIMRDAQAALQSSSQAKDLHSQRERVLEQQKLAEEIAASQGIVPDFQLDLARAALNGGLYDIRAAHQQLGAARQQALRTLSDRQAMQESLQRQATYVQSQVQQEMSVIQSVLTQQYSVDGQRFKSQMDGVQQQLDLATQHQKNAQAGQALQDAQKARERLQELKQDVSALLARDQETRRQQATQAEGKLEALEQMVKDAIEARLIPTSTSDYLLKQINTLRDEIRQAENGVGATALAGHIQRVEPLTRQVFTSVGNAQQEKIADVVATTLNEIGFNASEDENLSPTPRKIGAGLRITGMHDEKVVDLTLDNNGTVSYDFSGYTGNECESAADEVFKALRDKGIVIVDKNGERELQKYTPEQLTAELLKDGRFAPHFDANKRQAALSEMMMRILTEHLKFEHVFKITSEGSVVIDAFSDTIGYHITLSGQGEARVSRNGKVVMEQDLADPLFSALSLEAGKAPELAAGGQLRLAAPQAEEDEEARSERGQQGIEG